MMDQSVVGAKNTSTHSRKPYPHRAHNLIGRDSNTHNKLYRMGKGDKYYGEKTADKRSSGGAWEPGMRGGKKGTGF